MTLLPSTKPTAVERIHQGRPQEFETEGPEDKAEKGLICVADIFALQDEGDAPGQSQRNPLEDVEKQEEGHVA